MARQGASSHSKGRGGVGPFVQPSLRRDACDVVATGLREPDIPIGVRGYAGGSAVSRGDGKLGDVARGGDATDLVAPEFGEPQIAIGTGDNEVRVAPVGGNSELGDVARGGDASNLVALEL